MPKNAATTGFTPTVCGGCGQTTNYVTSVDKGMADIVRAFAFAIKKKGVNVIHPAKEMMPSQTLQTREEAIRDGRLTPSQANNLSRARSHGLLFRVQGHYGNWGLTRKGITFLRGEEIPKFVIIDKTTGAVLGNWKPDEYRVKMSDFSAISPDEYWSETIEQGRIVTPEQV